MFDTVALGELLVDFVLTNTNENFSQSFLANPGGAPCNVLCQLAKLGKSTAFVGKVGNDIFGNNLKNVLENYNIDTKSLILSDTEFTTLAFVTLDESGNREFSFARNNSADVMLNADEIDEVLIKNAKIFHCGTLSLTDECSKNATLKALKIAKENGVLISIDPNLRLPLWKSEDDAREAMKLALSYADVLKISDNEVEFLTGKASVIDGAREIFKEYSPKIMFVTCGKNGAFVLCGEYEIHHSGYPEMKTVDTTGAGDSFCGAVLSRIIDLGKNISEITENELADILEFANLTASLSTTGYGAMTSMKTREEIEEFKNGK